MHAGSANPADNDVRPAPPRNLTTFLIEIQPLLTEKQESDPGVKMPKRLSHTKKPSIAQIPSIVSVSQAFRASAVIMRVSISRIPGTRSLISAVPYP